ncbi:protein kinase [Chitinophagaceae bacterium LB-8]|uniref:Protein kinase n=1 Tax=Paraflavisolibacter caeni TaxID=2982496 RepID=A0A9X3BFX9_9BACT|nr:serine/threonine-protein kinase [Paraflavisolibacter caeni]MCU7549849.1 protein kinase [Paraflavisolibacter caeni]
MEFRDRYQFDTKTDFIAKGGFAKVYKAYDTMMDRTVALKVYSHEVSSKYDLIADMKRGSKLDHPNLCRYYDVAVFKKETAFGEEETQQVGVMEYLDGGNIKDYHKAHPEHLLKLLIDVLQGLTYLHEHELIHRDIKPQNILIKNTSRGPVAKITDFGISKVADSSATTKSSSLLGSIEYMAPEQFNPHKYGINGKISYNLDLWSFGCLTYELLKGVSIFGDKLAELSTEQMLIKMLDDIDLSRINSLPEPFHAISKCLVKDANQRISKADDLIEYFSNYLLENKVDMTPTPEQDATVVMESSKEKEDNAHLETVALDTGDGYASDSNHGKDLGTRSEEGSHAGNKKRSRRTSMILAPAIGLPVIFLVALLYYYPQSHPEISEVPADGSNAKVTTTDDSTKKSASISSIDTSDFSLGPSKNKNNKLKTVSTHTASSDMQYLYGLYDHAGDEYNYYGEVKNGKPHGYGIAKYTKGDVYEGYYKNGKMSGEGTYTWENGSQYIGQRKNDKRDGYGTFIYEDGSKYAGEWKNGVQSGEGKIYDSDGNLLYEGRFENGKMVDDLVDEDDDKDLTTSRNGYYVVQYEDGLYEGNFTDGQMDGQGTFTWSNGDKYTGTWKEGLMHGYGTYSAAEDRQIKNCPDCSVYKGYYVDGQKSGFGRCYDKNGHLLYEGQFKDGMPTDNYPNQ